MSMFLFDTNCWIVLLKGRSANLEARWRNMTSAELVTCSVVKAELWHGAHKYQDPAGRSCILNLWLEPYRSLPFDDAAARQYAVIRHYLEGRGEIIGPNDLKIAAICLAYDLTLVTTNGKEFGRVPGLRVEDWKQE